jgi:hypothetical protein
VLQVACVRYAGIYLAQHELKIAAISAPRLDFYELWLAVTGDGGGGWVAPALSCTN